MSPHAPDLYDVAAERFQGLPEGSWWIETAGHDQGVFYARVTAEAERMKRSKWGRTVLNQKDEFQV